LKEESFEVVVLGRPGCHLCEAVENELRSMKSAVPKFTSVNIDENSALHDRYFLRIPIVIVGGEVVFDGSMMDPKGVWKMRLSQLLS